jgi:hypothetical protein
MSDVLDRLAALRFVPVVTAGKADGAVIVERPNRR